MSRKSKRKNSGKRIFAAILLMAVITAFIYMSIMAQRNHQIFEPENEDKTSIDSSLNLDPDITEDIASVPPSEEPEPSVFVFFDRLNSPNAILIRLSDDTVLTQKSSEEKIYPASLTKMMTAIVAIENLPDVNEEIKLTNSTYQGLYEAGASMAGFLPGEQVRAIDLLYGVLLPSGAECCVALADRIAGSEQDFVVMMNQKAEDLGMTHTHFENTTGLHDDNHYTTVKDLAALLRYALQNSTFREIFTSSRHSTPPTNKHPDGITFHSTVFKELNNQSIADGKILGGKTGYTDEAGQCLASLAQVGAQEYILISAGANGDPHSEQYNITDALAVYNSIGKGAI